MVQKVSRLLLLLLLYLRKSAVAWRTRADSKRTKRQAGKRIHGGGEDDECVSEAEDRLSHRGRAEGGW
jgi:hypothetical protein